MNNALVEFKERRSDIYTVQCDVTKVSEVEQLAIKCKTFGEISTVVNCAGVSPHMTDYKNIIKINALGTMNVTDVFMHFIKQGGILINLSSMSADLLPSALVPNSAFKHSISDKENFISKMDHRMALVPKKQREGLTYGVTKQFVRWYSNAKAQDYAYNGLRILTVSPGLIDTGMGQLELEQGKQFIDHSAIKRLGKPEEVAQLIFNLCDTRLGYLTATDIRCDGGSVALHQLKQ